MAVRGAGGGALSNPGCRGRTETNGMSGSAPQKSRKQVQGGSPRAQRWGRREPGGPSVAAGGLRGGH